MAASNEENIIDGQYVPRYDNQLGPGNVYGGYRIDTNEEVAIKVVRERASNITEDESKKTEKAWSREEYQVSMKHENIAELFGAFSKRPERIDNELIVSRFLVMERCDGNLEQFMSVAYPPVKTKLDVAHQITKGLCFIHNGGIIHRNIKPSNILINHHNQKVFIKISDFRQSKDYERSLNLTTGVGSPDWQAPEVYTGQAYGYKADIFSTGHLILAVLSVDPPKSSSLVVFSRKFLKYLFLVFTVLMNHSINKYQ